MKSCPETASGRADRILAQDGIWKVASTGGPWSWNYLNMMSLPRGIATVPRSMSLSTGFTVGLGAATTAGALILLLAGPFKGP